MSFRTCDALGIRKHWHFPPLFPVVQLLMFSLTLPFSPPRWSLCSIGQYWSVGETGDPHNIMDPHDDSTNQLLTCLVFTGDPELRGCLQGELHSSESKIKHWKGRGIRKSKGTVGIWAPEVCRSTSFLSLIYLGTLTRMVSPPQPCHLTSGPNWVRTAIMEGECWGTGEKGH